MISFTGSPGVGRRIGELAGKHLKKVSLELGGSNSLIILDDADLDLAASNAAWGAWLHQGQICMALEPHPGARGDRRRDHERLVAKATHLPVGDGASGQVALGPLIDAQPAQRVHAIVQDSVAAGAQLRGRRQLRRPVLQADGADRREARHARASTRRRSARWPTSSPSAPTTRRWHWPTTRQGGLAAAVISRVGRARAWRSAAQLNAGMVHINDQTVNDECVNPFGGPGIAGNGSQRRRPGRLGASTPQWQWITVKDTPPRLPVLTTELRGDIA